MIRAQLSDGVCLNKCPQSALVDLDIPELETVPELGSLPTEGFHGKGRGTLQMIVQPLIEAPFASDCPPDVSDPSRLIVNHIDPVEVGDTYPITSRGERDHWTSEKLSELRFDRFRLPLHARPFILQRTSTFSLLLKEELSLLSFVACKKRLQDSHFREIVRTIIPDSLVCRTNEQSKRQDLLLTK